MKWGASRGFWTGSLALHGSALVSLISRVEMRSGRLAGLLRRNRPARVTRLLPARFYPLADPPAFRNQQAIGEHAAVQARQEYGANFSGACHVWTVQRLRDRQDDTLKLLKRNRRKKRALGQFVTIPTITHPTARSLSPSRNRVWV